MEEHLVNRTTPELEDEEPPTLASTGPEYESVLALVEAHQSRGLKTKPHYVKKWRVVHSSLYMGSLYFV